MQGRGRVYGSETVVQGREEIGRIYFGLVGLFNRVLSFTVSRKKGFDNLTKFDMTAN